MKNKIIHGFFMLWDSCPLQEATQEPKGHFTYLQQLHEDLAIGNISEEN